MESHDINPAKRSESEGRLGSELRSHWFAGKPTWGWLFVLCCALWAACGGGHGAEKNASTAEVRVTIGPMGGSVMLTQGPAQGAVLSIPKGALDAPVTITM